MKSTINYLGRIFTEKKYENVSKNLSGKHTRDNIADVLSGKILNPYEKANIPKDNTAINLSIKKILDMQSVNINLLKGKKILDIGCGFTGLPFLLNNINAEINIVDPIYSMDINLEINRNKLELLNNIKKFDEINYNFYEKKHYWKQEYYYTLNYEFNNILSDLQKWGAVNIEGDYFISGENKINVYPTTGEELIGIDKGTIDYIFINHTITKNQVDPYKLLEKADSLLKIGGKIYIIESGEIDFSFITINNHEFEIETFITHYLTRNPKTILILKKK